MNKQQATKVTLKEMRSFFSDGNDYSEKYVVGTYELMTELFDARVIEQISLKEIFAKLNRLSLREGIIIQYVYGIGRPKLSVAEISKRTRIRIHDVRRALSEGKRKLYALCSAL